MAMYTYDDFKKAAEESGLYESFLMRDIWRIGHIIKPSLELLKEVL